MNRWVSILLSLLLVLLLTACGQVEVTPDEVPSPNQSIEENPGSAEQKEPDKPEESNKPEETDQPEEPSESTENASPELQELSWVAPQQEKMSYEEYFSEDRPYFNDHYAYYAWLVPDGQSWRGYTLEFDYSCGLKVVQWDDSSLEKVAVHTVPDTVDLDMFELLGTDGTTAYLTPYSETKDCILAVDILTGSREYLIQDAVITTVYYRGDVLYYALYKDDMMQIVRRYLPTGDELYYPTEQKLAPMFSFHIPKSSSEPITWVGVTDKMTAAVIKELQDPNSEYRTGDRVPPDLWEINEPWINADRNPVHWLCLELQNSKNYRTLYKCTIDSDGSVISTATGVVDYCWYGSDMSHDHFDPDAARPTKPAPSFGAWEDFSERMTDTEAYDPEHSVQVYQNHAYAVAGNVYTLLTDTPIRSVYPVYTENYESINACYGITPDNQLVCLYPDGSTPTVLYQGSNIRYTSVLGDSMLVLDADKVIQLDLYEQKYRTVLRHENILRMYFDYDSVEPAEVIYIEINRGLHSTGYLLDLVTGDVKEVGYRL